MAADDRTADSTNPDEPSPDSLEKIRDILFGEQVRASEKRVAALSDRFAGLTNDLRGELLARLQSLETFARDETGSLGKRLAEQATAAEAFKTDTTEQLEALRAEFDERLTRLSREQAEELSGLRRQLLEQSQTLRDEISARVAELQAVVAAELTELRGAKVERSALSSMFADLAVRLSDADDGEILLGAAAVAPPKARRSEASPTGKDVKHDAKHDGEGDGEGELIELVDPESIEPRRGQGAG